ncbi:PREDICTED: transmembrane protein 115, partial [Mesitornis unicolor]|uniref:transmembrane protein 115 n=1 Tax=Mesitornis unicolor TaxID=54374 RepID=UPI0005282D9F
VVVKSLSAAVFLLYLLSFGLDTAYGLGVTPGYLLPPNFWVWTLLTHGLVEERAWGFARRLSNLLASYGFGLLSSWVYLRFYQRHSRGRGDMSDHFAFATFFPEILQPVVGLVANLVHSLLVKVKVCRKTVKRYDVGAPSSITISLPGTDPQDAERRRQLALKALNERLKRVEDQSAWPSMEDEEEEAGAKADSPLLPDPGTAGKGTTQESSLITFQDAPSQL